MPRPSRPQSLRQQAGAASLATARTARAGTGQTAAPRAPMHAAAAAQVLPAVGVMLRGAAVAKAQALVGAMVGAMARGMVAVILAAATRPAWGTPRSAPSVTRLKMRNMP